MEVRTTTTDTTRDTVLQSLRRTRQIRSFTDEPVSEEDLHAILEVARWTGSSMNTQPWQFIVVRDPDVRRRIGDISVHARYVSKAPLAIAIAMPGEDSESDAYDEARVAERILIAATAMDLGAGIGWIEAKDYAAIDELLGLRGGAEATHRATHRTTPARGVRARPLRKRRRLTSGCNEVTGSR
jgi:nitroreductase